MVIERNNIFLSIPPTVTPFSLLIQNLRSVYSNLFLAKIFCFRNSEIIYRSTVNVLMVVYGVFSLQFYGPRIGAVYARNLSFHQTPLYPMFYGGGQEREYRPGYVL